MAPLTNSMEAYAQKMRGIASINKATPHIMHIDLNSCFATIEQQANPLIRNKPVAVAAYDRPTGIVLAASYDAKAIGIKLGVPVREARKIYPDIIVLAPDPPKYREAHKRFREVLFAYTSEVTPKSIDEFVINFEGSEALRKGRDLRDVGYEIKDRIKEQLGEYVTVNVGIGVNRFLAKLAAGLHKPDGLNVLDHTNLLQAYTTLDLMDLPGINRRYKARLLAAGIATPTDFFEASGDYLQKFVFHSKLGHYWFQRLRGWEVDNRTFNRKTIGHQYALEHKTTDKPELQRLLMKLCEKVGRRLRGANLSATGIHLHIRFVGYQYWHKGRKTEHPLYTTQDIYMHVIQLFNEAQLIDKVSLFSVTVFNLQAGSSEQLGLFEHTIEKQKALARAADDANDHFGEFTVIPAIMADMDKTILDRIAFGGITEL